MKKTLLIIVAVLIGAQLIPVERSNPPVQADFNENDEVKKVFKRACYDCHSNETVWPLYSYVAPVSWMVSAHVEEGREELNFSDWNHYTDKKKRKKAEEALEEIEKGKMPMPGYTMIHKEAALSEQDIQLVRRWANETYGSSLSEPHEEARPAAQD
ncbi:conserved hypothetical protein; putative signal peptide [Chloroherpeton thalassium ATCC 35110]|uniref:Haem-binding domain-containing protein n=1 Tax=Chloroherpeton thalassium (strain ATCC 35110 / GB-78) TaxID=517418 RepID=B3QW97_CHLT3|nr:heme-binding domain-containing protein [Chloroherpeton thalassium]ACF13210.1 conserved hypothetical protein; putative signal peptide [Chloroherpeton thalassium ATCC 35110]